jgi:hypothetical protein
MSTESFLVLLAGNQSQGHKELELELALESNKEYMDTLDALLDVKDGVSGVGGLIGEFFRVELILMVKSFSFVSNILL